MKNKILVWGSTIASVVGGVAVSALTHAAGFLTVPTGTAATYTAQVSSQFSDAGTLEIVAVVVAIPLFFYVVHQVIGLFPKARGRKQ